MMAEMVKLTLRLPAGLHKQIKERAHASDASLNKTIIEALRWSISQNTTYKETESEKTHRVIRESGMLEPLGPQWLEGLDDVPDITHEELWELTKGISPLSDTIIEEREPRE